MSFELESGVVALFIIVAVCLHTGDASGACRFPTSVESVHFLAILQKLLYVCHTKRPSRVSMNHAQCIHLETDTPVKARPRRILPAWEEGIARQFDEMCTNGICTPSKSPWGREVVLVEKKDGQMRFAIYYRQLNAVTKKDTYGPPNPHSILDKLEGCRYFSYLDVAIAYWTVSMRKSGI